MANSVDPDQTAPLGAIWSGSTLFAQTCLYEKLRIIIVVSFFGFELTIRFYDIEMSMLLIQNESLKSQSLKISKNDRYLESFIQWLIPVYKYVLRSLDGQIGLMLSKWRWKDRTKKEPISQFS